MKKILLVLVAMFSFLLLNDRVFAFDFTGYGFYSFDGFEDLIEENVLVQDENNNYQPLNQNNLYNIMRVTNNYVVCLFYQDSTHSFDFTNGRSFKCAFTNKPLKVDYHNNLGDEYYYLVDENGDRFLEDVITYYLQPSSSTINAQYLHKEFQGIDTNPELDFFVLREGQEILSNYDLIDIDTNDIFNPSAVFDDYTYVSLAYGESVALIPKEPFEEDYKLLSYVDYMGDEINGNLYYGFYNMDSGGLFSDMRLVSGSNYIIYPAVYSQQNSYLLVYNGNDVGHTIRFYFDATNFNYIIFDTYKTPVYYNGQTYNNPNEQIELIIKQQELEEGMTGNKGFGFSTLLDILAFIPNLIVLFASVITTIFTLISLFFSSMPIYISLGLQAIFYITIIILLIKALK